MRLFLYAIIGLFAIVFIMNTAEASDEWQQISGNSTTALTTGSDVCVTGSVVRCQNVTLTANTSYYIISGYVDSTHGGGEGKWTLNHGSNSSLGSCAATEVMFSVQNVSGVPTLVDNEETTCAGTTTLIYSGASTIANSMWNVVKIVPYQTGPVVISRTPNSDYYLTSWTESGIDGLLLRAIGFGQPDVMGYVFSDIVPPTPTPPILTGVVDGVFNQLNWTVGFGVTGGYNLTRCDIWNACMVFTFGPATLGYRDGSDTTNRTYTVHGWNANGNSIESNNVTLKIGSQPLFSDSSALYGGSKTNLAAGLGMTPTAIGALWGLLLVLMLAAGGYGLFRGMGAAFGGFAGTVTALAIGMWPVWLVFLLCAVAASVWVLINMRKGGE